jgi:hypothetical protein
MHVYLVRTFKLMHMYPDMVLVCPIQASYIGIQG